MCTDIHIFRCKYFRFRLQFLDVGSIFRKRRVSFSFNFETKLLQTYFCLIPLLSKLKLSAYNNSLTWALIFYSTEFVQVYILTHTDLNNI